MLMLEAAFLLNEGLDVLFKPGLSFMDIGLQPVLEGHKQSVQGLRQEIARYMEMGGIPPKAPQEAFTQRQKHRDIDYTPEL